MRVTMVWFLKFTKDCHTHSGNHKFEATTKDWALVDRDILIEDFEKNGWTLTEMKLICIEYRSS